MKVLTLYCPRCDKGTSFDLGQLLQQEPPADVPCYLCGSILCALEDIDKEDLVRIDEVENKDELV